MVVRMLFYPQMKIQHDLTLEDDYILLAPFCLIRVQCLFEANLIRIHLYSNLAQDDPALGFLCYFVFQSPSIISKQLCGSLKKDNVTVFFQDQLIGTEANLIKQVMKGVDNILGIPDLLLSGVFYLTI
jgi:exosortase/archaeosortase